VNIKTGAPKKVNDNSVEALFINNMPTITVSFKKHVGKVYGFSYIQIE